MIDPGGGLFRKAEIRCIGRERVGDADPWRMEYSRAESFAPEMTRVSTFWVTDDGELVQVEPEGGSAMPVEKWRRLGPGYSPCSSSRASVVKVRRPSRYICTSLMRCVTFENRFAGSFARHLRM